MSADRASDASCATGSRKALLLCCRHRDRVLVVRPRPRCVHPGPVLRPARRTCALRRLGVRTARCWSPTSSAACFIRLKVAFLAGAVLSAPFWLYQLWAFITPGLKRNEKRYGIGLRRRLDGAVRRSAPCWPTSRCQGPEAAARPGRRRRGRRAHRAGLHRASCSQLLRGLRRQLRGAADRGRAQPRRRAEPTRCWRRAGAGSSSSPSSSPRSSRRRRTRSRCC